MKTITFILCILSLFCVEIQAQDVSNDSIQNIFLEQISLYPQEKIYVHTDKPSYVSGDTIWLRVHLVDALLLKQANASRYVYVELINLLSDVVERAMLAPDSMGCFYGYVSLDEALPEGNYTLRAYTRFMQNQGEDYFFRKPVYIIDPLSAEISPVVDFTFNDNKVDAAIYFTETNGEDRIVPEACSLFVDGNLKGEEKKLSLEQESAQFSFDLTKAQNQPVFLLQTTYKGRTYNRFFTVPQPDDAFDVSFFPEGGHAPLQADIRIAFKALKKNGLHENVKGTVYDDTGKEWAHFESLHLGMGQFRMHYLQGRAYHVVCTNEENISKRFGLPAPESNTMALKAQWSGGNLRLTLSSPSDYVLPQGLHLVAHIRGAVLYSQPWTDTRGYLFEKDFFPAGIVHFLLIDKDRNILSERLVFSSQSSTFANVSVAPDKQTYQTRDKISLGIKVSDEYDTPLSGNFSIAVVDRRDVAIDTVSNIISRLLLTSELKGHIESPMSYFKDDGPLTIAALDVLMMTQGWRRYNVPEILKGNLHKELKFPLESSRRFSGKVSGVFSALKDGSISMIAHKDSILGTSFVKPEEDGKFVFDNVDYPDSTQYLIQALRKKGSSLAFIEMDSVEVFPPVVLPPLVAPEMRSYEESYLDKANEKYTIENGMRLINLAEVEVKGQRKIQRKTESPYYSISSSFVLASEEIEKANFMNVFDLLRRLPGVTISGSEVYYRQATPMLILDNVPTENFDYSLLNVNDISDAFVSPATSVMPIFGARAANGAIVINTKKGFVEKNRMNKNMQVFTPIGYQQHVEFYSPAYETEEQRKNTATDMRSTIYWNPSVHTDSTGIAHLGFYSADSPSQYSIVIEGVSSAGHLVYSSKEVVEVEW
ncbi:hypothetical protein [Gaoshiqia sp. Z1-71]|uniref:hypothetical protein n=1 Tax=Gaoshiqia hydrogeniformans TaxID=3290090 RepID=UPI003BF8D791